MPRTLRVPLKSPPNELAREEITKQVAFLSKDIKKIGFEDGGGVLRFEAPDQSPEKLAEAAQALASRVQRGLRSLERKVAYRSPAANDVEFQGHPHSEDVVMLGKGFAGLRGIPARLHRYFARIFDDFGDHWNAEPIVTPTLISAPTLAKCGYFGSFPHSVSFACHLSESSENIEDFRARHADQEHLDEETTKNFEQPDTCLSPAVCYHVYDLCRDSTVPSEGRSYRVQGKCFRYESSNMQSLRRLWDFTMSEVVFLGTREGVLGERERAMRAFEKVMESHEIAGEFRTASDPFFAAPDATAKTYFQLTGETKFEISLLLPDSGRIAAGSFNYHTDFFGRVFDCNVEGAGPMHSVCVAFGIERWVFAYLAQHGSDPKEWPEVVRNAPEFES